MRQPECHRFGPYEVFPHIPELRKTGIRIKLPDQPFKILTELISRPGQLVTRQELIRLLWPDGTYVDFEKSLNTAVNKLRDVLCDSAISPRYIETVPRHGYRFIGEVETTQTTTAPDVLPSSSAEQGSAPGASSERQLRGPTLRWAAALTLICMTAIVLVGHWISMHPLRRGAKYQVIPLTAYPGLEQSPSFSPDGSHIVFAWRRQGRENFNIFIQSIGAPEARPLTTSEVEEFSPTWSPDGQTIAYLRGKSGRRFELMLVAPSGGEPRKITETSLSFGVEPLPLIYQRDLLAWTPDSKSIVFPDTGAGEYASLWRAEIGSTVRTQITRAGPRERHSIPRISTDGRQLAYQQQGGKYGYQLVTVPLAANRLGVSHPELRAYGLLTAPVGWLGHDILFLRRNFQGGGDLQRWSASQPAEPFQIPGLAGLRERIGPGAVSADHRRLAFPVYRGDCDLWQLDLSGDGSGFNPRALIVSTSLELAADFSPDGQQLVFKSDRSSYHEAWLASSDGSNQRQLTTAHGLGVPRWSPDGRTILFNRGEGGNEELYLATAATGAIRQLTFDPATDKEASWSRNGQWIYFTSDRTGRNEIWKLRLDGQAVQVTFNGGVSPFESPDGRHLYFGKTDGESPYVWRIPVGGGVEQKLFPSLLGWASLAMGPKHLYFVRNENSINSTYGTVIFSYSFQTGQIVKVADLGTEVMSIAVTPDERRLVYGAFALAGADIMLVNRSEE